MVDFLIVQLLFPCLGVMLLRGVGVLLSSVVKEIGGIVHFPRCTTVFGTA